MWPIGYYLFTGVIAYDELVTALGTIAEPESATQELRILFWFHVGTTLLLFCTFIFYSYRLYIDRSVSGESKMLWFLAFIVLTSFAFLAYWWRHIRLSGHLNNFVVQK